MGGPKKLADFLARDFGSADSRSAAAKNAYVLLGQHKQGLAATFFLLGEWLSPTVAWIPGRPSRLLGQHMQQLAATFFLLGARNVVLFHSGLVFTYRGNDTLQTILSNSPFEGALDKRC